MDNQQQIIETLDRLKSDGKLIKLKLWPPKWSTIIEKEENRMEINGGNDGMFEGISEKFYDEMVIKYSRK